MLEYLSHEISEGLALARQRRAKRSRLRVRIGETLLPLVSLQAHQFVIEAAPGVRLRGFVDIYDGGRHILHGLVVATRQEGGQILCDFKRMSSVHAQAPLDYWRDESLPAGYLPPN